jgi:hypothetical protein
MFNLLYLFQNFVKGLNSDLKVIYVSIIIVPKTVQKGSNLLKTTKNF